MALLANHIILIGFKHVGKSIVGKQLAKKLQMPFVDLDEQIEYLYQKQVNKKMACRQILKHEGEKYFRLLEKQALAQISTWQPSVISLGGGTPLDADNQRMIEKYILIHIKAPQGVVFERILMNGRPSFFNPQETILESFNRLWHEREPIYEKINDFSILNIGTVNDSVYQIIKKLDLGV